MPSRRNAVVITTAPEMDYTADYVALPRDYGTPAYYARPDIRAIIAAVHENLTRLDGCTGFVRRLTGQRVVVKVTCVFVCHDFGFVERDYPNTTDPRVLDAVVHFLAPHAGSIAVTDAAPMCIATRGSFRLAGIDRLCRHHNIELLCLDELPVDRYILPHAQAMRDVVISRVYSEVAEGRAFMVTIPKLKTNLCADVSLGIKNSMGCLPINQRHRGHHFDLAPKLVDLLHLVRPGLTVVDGIVGGEGQSPAPPTPVNSRLIISGTNVVETDRVAASLMRQDPDRIELITNATERGFGDSHVLVVGKRDPMRFSPADPSLLNDTFHQLFPNVRVLIGHGLPTSHPVHNRNRVSPAAMIDMERDCIGGCLSCTRGCFETLRCEGLNCTFALTIIIGRGVCIEGQPWYFDRHGKPYSLADVGALPRPLLAVGDCASTVTHLADEHVEGCIPNPIGPHFAIHRLTGTRCAITDPLRNPQLLLSARAALGRTKARVRLLRNGHRLDIASAANGFQHTGPPELRELTRDELRHDLVRWDLPPLAPDETRHLIRQEWRQLRELTTLAL